MTDTTRDLNLHWLRRQQRRQIIGEFFIGCMCTPSHSSVCTCEHLLSRHDTAMSSEAATSDSRQTNLLLVHATRRRASEATLRSVTELQQAGSISMGIPYRYTCAYSFSNGKCFLFWVFKLIASSWFSFGIIDSFMYLKSKCTLYNSPHLWKLDKFYEICFCYDSL